MSAGNYVQGAIVGCVLLLLVLWLPAWMAEVHRQRVKAAPKSVPPPDWSAITDYVELANTASTVHRLSVDEFLDGPFRRFLEICLTPDEYPRARARMMEFGRAAFIGYLRSQAEHGAPVASIRARGRAMVVEWCGRPESANGDYMLEVFDGYSTHNYRGKPDAAFAHLSAPL